MKQSIKTLGVIALSATMASAAQGAAGGEDTAPITFITHSWNAVSRFCGSISVALDAARANSTTARANFQMRLRHSIGANP